MKKTENTERIYVAGHNGMVGSATVRKLQQRGFANIVTRNRDALDLTDQAEVRGFFQNTPIDRVILAAAKVGGIHANNSQPAEFIYENLMITANVIHEAYTAGITKLLFLGSSCIYPKFAPQPITEDALLTGPLEPTNEPYAIAKISGIKMCEAYNRQYGTQFLSVMPTNLYGPHDNYDLESSHVIPAMIRKFDLARLAMEGDAQGIMANSNCYGPIPEQTALSLGFNPKTGELDKDVEPRVILWGTGSPRREFLHVDDMADACLHLMEIDYAEFKDFSPALINIGYGSDMTIRDAAAIIADVVGYHGPVEYDSSFPDGTPQKLINSALVNRLGWKPAYDFVSGIKQTFIDYKKY